MIHMMRYKCLHSSWSYCSPDNLHGSMKKLTNKRLLHHTLAHCAACTIAWCILQGSLLHNLAGCRALLMCIHPSIVSLSPPSSHSSALQTPQLHLCPQTPTQLHLPSDHPNYMLNFNCMLKLEGRVHCTLFNHPCF